MRWLACAVGASVLLLSTSESWGKGASIATVCGASACKTYRGEFRVLPIYDWWNEPFALLGPPKPAPYFRIRLVDPGVQTSILLYAPVRRSMRIWRGRVLIPGPSGPIGPYWRAVPRRAAADLEPFIRGLRPFPASRGWRH